MKSLIKEKDILQLKTKEEQKLINYKLRQDLEKERKKRKERKRKRKRKRDRSRRRKERDERIIKHIEQTIRYTLHKYYYNSIINILAI